MGVASGMFYVLAGGLVLALTVFVIQWVYYRRSKNEEVRGKKHEQNNKTEENNLHNHVDRNTSSDLGKDRDDELITVLTRTLSIGENSSHSRWQGEHL